MLSYMWDGAYKRTLAANEKKRMAHEGSKFPVWLSEWSLQYAQHHITSPEHLFKCILFNFIYPIPSAFHFSSLLYIFFFCFPLRDPPYTLLDAYLICTSLPVILTFYPTHSHHYMGYSFQLAARVHPIDMIVHTMAFVTPVWNKK